MPATMKASSRPSLGAKTKAEEEEEEEEEEEFV
jgi:hypothetical protein